MTAPTIIYFSDPMCSWCWGFSPVIEAISARYGHGLPIKLIMGGLRPGTLEPMSDKARREVRSHWAKVTEASGQLFDRSVVDKVGFVYNTDPPARAVVVARRAGATQALALLRSAHRAFYVEGRDITDLETLAELAGELGMEPKAFLADLQSDEATQETWADYNTSLNAGVAGFPTLVIGPKPDGQYTMITRGFRTSPEVLASIDHWLSNREAA